MSARDSRSSRLHAGQRRGGRGSRDAADSYAFGKHVVIVVTPLAWEREAFALLRLAGPCQCQYFWAMPRAATTPSNPNYPPALVALFGRCVHISQNVAGD